MQSTWPQKIKMFCSLGQSHNSVSPDSPKLQFLRNPWTRCLELVNHLISKLFQLSECQFQMTVKPGSSTRGELDTSLSWWSSPLPPSSPWPSIIRLFFTQRSRPQPQGQVWRCPTVVHSFSRLCCADHFKRPYKRRLRLDGEYDLRCRFNFVNSGHYHHHCSHHHHR